MIATVITMGQSTRVLLSQEALDVSTRSKLERAGYKVHTCLQPKHVAKGELVATVVPLLQHDLFAGLS